MQPGLSVSYVARRAGIAPSQLFAWKRRMLEGGAAAVHADEDVVGASRVRELEKRVRDLARMLGRKTMEAEILKEALDLASPKKPALRLASFDKDFPMRAVADTLGAARSHLAEQANRLSSDSASSRGPYAKAGDEAVLPALHRLVDERPSYGYRRITALLNRERRKEGRDPVNRKRVLRIMQGHGLTLTRHTGVRPGRTHQGVVIALRSNVRWCSDHLELTCRNGDIVRVLFVIDVCDREIIAWSAIAHAGVSGEMVRDLMVEAVERRFAAQRPRIRWNGCPTTAAPISPRAPPEPPPPLSSGLPSLPSVRPKATAWRKRSLRP